MHKKLLQNISSESFQNKPKPMQTLPFLLTSEHCLDSVVEIKWASASCFHGWGEKGGWGVFSV